MSTYNARITTGTVQFDTTAGDVTVQMLPFAQTPNQTQVYQKLTPDTNKVIIQTAWDGVTNFDTFPAGATIIELTDNDANYFTRIKIPGSGLSPCIVEAGVGSPGGGGASTSINVVSATAVVTYALSGNSTIATVAGVITLPMTLPAEIQIAAYPPGSGSPIAANPNGIDLVSPITNPTGSTVAYASTYQMPLPAADQPGWTIVFTAYDANGNPAPSPYTTTFDLNAIIINSVVCEEVPGSRYIDATQETHTIVNFTPTPNHTDIPYYSTQFLYERQVSGQPPAWFWQGWEAFGPGGTLTFSLDILVVDGPSVAAQGACIVGTIPGDFNALMTLPVGAVVDATTFPLVIEPPIVGGLSSPLGSISVTNASGAPPTLDNIYMGINSLGNPYCAVLINVTTPLDGDPNCWYYQGVLYWSDSLGNMGNPGGVDNPSGYQIGDQFPNTGVIGQWSSGSLGPGLFINYPSPNAMSTANLPIEYLNITFYALNRNSQNGASPWDGSDPNTVLETATFMLHVGQGGLETNNANMIVNPFNGANSVGLKGWIVNSGTWVVDSSDRLEVTENGVIEEQVPHTVSPGQSYTLEFTLSFDPGKAGNFIANAIGETAGGGQTTIASLSVTNAVGENYVGVLVIPIPTSLSPATVDFFIQFAPAGDSTGGGGHWYVQNVFLVKQIVVTGALTTTTGGAVTVNSGNGLSQSGGTLTTANGPGLTWNGGGFNVPNLGYTLGVNTTVGSPNYGQMYFSNLQALTSLPGLPSTSYPSGSAVLITIAITDPSTGHPTPADTVYRVASGGLQWAASNTPADLVTGAIATGVTLAAAQITAGTLIAGVVYSGQINAVQINAGTIKVSSPGTALTIKYTGDSTETFMFPGFMSGQFPSGAPAWQLGFGTGGVYSQLAVNDTSGNVSILAPGYLGLPNVADAGPGVTGVYIGGNRVLYTRVVTTPVTLSDVIAVLQHHGLSN